MTTYKVSWLRKYTEEGMVEIKANSPDEAENIALKNIGDYEGALTWDSEGDEIIVSE